MVRVTISQGTLVGAKRKTANDYEYTEFLQIPFAKPPVGELRFKSPQPAERWSGEKDATTYDASKICLQYDIFSKSSRGSEDCLYLNIYTSKLPENNAKLLPVMVYIHGGGFIGGSGTNKLDNGPDFLLEQDVLFVTINYRLNIFGFLSLDIPEAAGNMGLKDQVMALKWVQNNIEKFGGDKSNVTIFGNSAGSASVEYLLLSPLSKGLFHKAILQSGSTLNHWAINYDAKLFSVKVAQKLGFEGSSNDVQAIHEFLLKQSKEALSEASSNFFEFIPRKGLDFGFVPCIEKENENGDAFITESPYSLIKRGSFHKVDVIRGFCEYEGYLSLGLLPQNIQEIKENRNFTDFWKFTLEASDINKYNNKFNDAYLNQEKDEKDFAVDFFTDFDFVAGVEIGSKLMSGKGVSVYSYMFTYDGERNFIKKMFLNDPTKKGACHSDDMGYILGTLSSTGDDIIGTESDMLVIAKIAKLWTNFAKTGNPTPVTSDLIPVQWPRFTCDQQLYLKIDKELTVESKYYPERMAVFEEIYEKYAK